MNVTNNYIIYFKMSFITVIQEKTTFGQFVPHFQLFKTTIIFHLTKLEQWKPLNVISENVIMQLK